MNFKIFFITFFTIFLAELGDKTQLATIGFTVENNKYKLFVFLGAAFALILTSFIGVFFGSVITKYFPEKYIKFFSAILFLIIGIIMLISLSREQENQNAKIMKLIEKISSIEKCNNCVKFNKFKEDNQIIDSNKKLKKEDLHEPYNCENCNTEKLYALIKNKKENQI
ncbi:MAG TPA: TMEM165/GDT1 family protein [bacterium]|nr:TMEM165/GDT1 family protein [bacterium]HOL47652.1 TMEM165/GDT1 family protein [bacterium]HPQ18410.1 TMEM165/GDT1 family protein [bacterium]